MQDRIDALEKDIQENRVKLKEVSDSLVELRIQHAQLMEKLGQMTTKMDNFSSGINRGLWILGGGFLTALATWITGGGLDR